MSYVLRIIDANGNRAREALRVMEEAARFVLEDGELAGALKQLRHDVSQEVDRFEVEASGRDTPGDVGTVNRTEQESTRESVYATVAASGKRLGEALRALEEYGKLLAVGEQDVPVDTDMVLSTMVDLPARIERIRYRGYELERRLLSALAGGRAAQWRLCVLVSERLCVKGDWWGVVESVVASFARRDAGAEGCIQLREHGLADGELLRRARDLVKLARPRGVSVIVNNRPDIAVLAGADGVHLGQADLGCADARRLVGRRLLIGVSTADLEQAGEAMRAGADYCGLGPMFLTETKKKDVIAGPGYVEQFVARHLAMPHLAIGGITAENVSRVIEAGARGVAVSRAVCSADDPSAVVAELLKTLSQVGTADIAAVIGVEQ